MRSVTSSRTVHWATAAAALAVVLTMALSAGASYRLVVLSDRTGGHQQGVYPSIIEEINLLKPDIVLTVGDQIEGYGTDMEAVSAEWDTLLAMLDVLDAPVYLTAGNHDIWSDESEELYRERTGFDAYYSFDHESTHFVVLDNSRYEAWDQIDDEQLDWLLSDLREYDLEDQIFVFYHKPLWLMTTAAGAGDPVHELLVQYGVDAVFTGHFHHYFHGTYDGIPYTSIGSSGGYMYRPETEPVARGEFFQFCWLTVHEDSFDLAVIDAGGIYPMDFHTVDDEREIVAIESEYITVSPLRVSEDGGEPAEIVVTVENNGPAPIDDAIRWGKPDGWVIEPLEAAVVVEPGAVGEYMFSVEPPDAVFPAPTFALAYPMTNGMEIETDVQLRVMRTTPADAFRAKPDVDGILAEPCWLEAAPVTRLYPAYDDSDIDGGTEFRFGHDDQYFYASAVCFEPQVDEIVATGEERDSAVYRDDCVGFFIQPVTDEMTVYQLYCNPLGTVFDQRITFDEGMIYTTDVTWDGEYEAVSKVYEDRWVFEAAIPLSEFGAVSGEDDAWRVNFRRKQQRTGGVEDWQIPIDYNPNTFGELLLK